MQQKLLDQMKEITEEEQKILEGRTQVERERYVVGEEFTIDSRKMLEQGQLIAVRKHTRFVHFPSHRHTPRKNIATACPSLHVLTCFSGASLCCTSQIHCFQQIEGVFRF